MLNIRRVLAFASGAVALSLGSAAHAGLTINPTWDASITSDPNAAIIMGTINSAIAFYSQTFTDNITVEITFQKMNSGLGQSTTGIFRPSYVAYRSALVADASTANDFIALAHLPNQVNDPVTNAHANMILARANARALGGTTTPGTDGTVYVNTSICNLDRSSIDPNKYDLYAVTCHEIDEVLGMGSWNSKTSPGAKAYFDAHTKKFGGKEPDRWASGACWAALAPNGAIYYNHKPRILDGILVEPRDYVPPELPLRQRVIWARAGGVNFSPVFYVPTYEEILILAKPDFRLKSKGASGAGDVWSVPQISGTWHPAPFPLVLAERVIETVMPALVCDPFMGSGTTAKAARRYHVDWMGCEKSAKYAARATLEIEAIQPRAAAMIADQEAFV